VGSNGVIKGGSMK